MDVCTQGHWASICYNEDLELAGIICKMLGFPMQGNKMYNTIFKMKFKCTNVYTGAMAKSTTSIDPKVNCTVTDDGTTLNCVDTIQSHICDIPTSWKCYNFFLSNRILTKVNESYNGTFLKQPNVSSQDPNYDTVTTGDEAVGDYAVIDNFKPKPRTLQISNPHQ